MNTDKLLDIYTLKLSLLSARELRFSGGLKLAVARSDDGSEITFALYEEQQVEDAAAQAEQEGPLQSPEGEALPGEGGVGGESPLPDAGLEKGQVVEGVGGETKVDDRPFSFDERAEFQRFWRGLDAMKRSMAEMTALHDGAAFGRTWAANGVDAVHQRAPRTDARDEPPVNPAWKMAHDLGALISTARAALDDLQVAACRAIDDCDVTEGQLVIERRDDTGEVKATVAWPDSDSYRSFVVGFCVEGKLLKVEE